MNKTKLMIEEALLKLNEADFKDENKEIPLSLTFDDVLLLPDYSEVTPPAVNLNSRIAEGIVLDVPILSAPMDTVTEFEMLIALAEQGGLGILHRNLTVESQASLLCQALACNVKAGAAVGIGPDFISRVSTLAALNPTVLCIDSAHGYTKGVLEGISYIKSHYPNLTLITGNVATYEGAKNSFEAGADIVKVGMGSGSICTTRIMSGVGVPQLTAILQASKAAREFGKHVIADGGIRTSGDIVKALAAGASAVMLGSLLAGTEESAGDTIEVEGKKYKRYRGMGSRASMAKGSAARYGQVFSDGDLSKLVPEGIEGLVPCIGPLKHWLHQVLGGLRSGFAYIGASTILELQQKARFTQITHSGYIESHPHSIHK